MGLFKDVLNDFLSLNKKRYDNSEIDKALDDWIKSYQNDIIKHDQVLPFTYLWTKN